MVKLFLKAIKTELKKRKALKLIAKNVCPDCKADYKKDQHDYTELSRITGVYCDTCKGKTIEFTSPSAILSRYMAPGVFECIQCKENNPAHPDIYTHTKEYLGCEINGEYLCHSCTDNLFN